MPFKTCGPNEVLVVSGCCLQRPLMIAGGRKFVLPLIQYVQRLSLNVLTLVIESPKIFTKHGVSITVTGVAQVQISTNPKMMRLAVENFLDKDPSEIHELCLETLEGHQRAIIGGMTVEEIIMDRKKFSDSVFCVASEDLAHIGIHVVSYTLKDINDEGGYLISLGRKRTAQVKKDARIGEAEANRDAEILKAKAEEMQMTSKLNNETEIAKAQRDFSLKKASYDIEVNSKKAESDLAYNIQAAISNQNVKEEEMKVRLIERSQQIELEDLEIARQERQLDATVRKPAEAERYKLEKIAAANKLQIVKEAEAAAEAIRLKGEAEAFAIEAKAHAEAEQMNKKAEAWKEYQGAAKLEMVLNALPRLASEIATPLANVEKVTMVTDISSPDANLGASKLTNEVMQIMERMPNLLKTMTGVDIGEKMKIGS